MGFRVFRVGFRVFRVGFRVFRVGFRILQTPNISDINIEKIFIYVSSTTVQTRVQCNENSTRSYENLSVSKLVKTAI